MGRFIADALLVVESSARTQYLALLSVVGPSLILAVGAYGVASITFDEPFGTLAPAARETVFHLSVAAAVSVWLTALSMAASEFRRARKRIFG